MYTGDYLQKICHEKKCMKCLYCDSVGETPLHLFFTCNVIKPLWTYVENLLQDISAQTVSITFPVVLWTNFAKSNCQFSNNLFIYLVSELKWTIWKCRNEIKYHRRSFTVNNVCDIFPLLSVG